MEPVKVQILFKDGNIKKGYTLDFNPNNPAFHLNENINESSHNQAISLNMKEIKAVLFVKTFEGKKYTERKEFNKSDHVQGRRVVVTFVNGEVVQGSTMSYDPNRLGFFLIPVDPASNNIRIFVISDALKSFHFL